MAAGMIGAHSCPRFCRPRGVPAWQAGRRACSSAWVLRRKTQSLELREEEAWVPPMDDLSTHPLSPIQVLPDGTGQAPAYILATEDEGTAGEEAGQGLRPAFRGGEGETPAGEGLANQAEAGAQGAEPVTAVIGLGGGHLTATGRQGAWPEAEVQYGLQGGKAQWKVQFGPGLCKRLKYGEEPRTKSPCSPPRWWLSLLIAAFGEMGFRVRTSIGERLIPRTVAIILQETATTYQQGGCLYFPPACSLTLIPRPEMPL